MKIAPLSVCKLLNFNSKFVYVNPNDALSQEQMDYIDDFKEGKRPEVKYLGEDVASKAFYSPIYNFAIKKETEK